MTCMCGDTRCPSCGVAQGNSRCPICNAWAEDGCEHFDEKTGAFSAEHSSAYVLQPTTKTHCISCGEPVYLLCHKTWRNNEPAFYICFAGCRTVAQIGVGPVPEEAVE